VAPMATTEGPAVPRRVLVVDDNPDFTSCLSAMLEAIGHEVHEANDGLSALAGVDEFTPHVLVLDLVMPFMSGFEVAERVRQLPGGEEMTIVAITGNRAPGDLGEITHAGFDHCLIKPFGFEMLRTLIDASAARRPRLAIAGPAGMTPMSMAERIVAADEASALGDAAAFADAVLPMVALTSADLAIDLVGVLAVSHHDLELASARWSRLRQQLRR
jgi:CheY-like chemotaxis protein